MKLLKIERAVILGLLITITASTISGFSAFAAQCGDIRQSVLRLHILANSDSEADQQLKLNVRDKILENSQEIFGTAQTKEQAEENVREKLPEITKLAQDEVYSEGYSYKVNASLVNMYFTTRKYGNVTLPAGYYDAVRITIGEAKGHNWWCVLFPSLCLPAAEETQTDKLSDVLPQNEVGIVEGADKKDIVVKFKAVEICEQIKDFFVSHFGN
jgi:stage II sporulation protein R